MIRVGFILPISDVSWIGGLNYFQNLINAVWLLSDRRIEPVLFVPKTIKQISLDRLPEIEIIRSPLVSPNFTLKLLQKVSKFFLGKNVLIEALLRKNRVDILSHYSADLGKNSKIPILGWMPDFQHIHYPEFFSKRDLRSREKTVDVLVRRSTLLLVSSRHARHDLLTCRPQAAAICRELPFVAGMIRPEIAANPLHLNRKYGVNGPFFYLPNQFWRHKNHGVVLEALAILARQGRAPLIVATGHTHDPRNPGYFDELIRTAEALGIAPYFKVLGLVPYSDMELLMAQAMAIVNPSLFEGWSTTVEEAKSLGKRLILSNIAVHREQAPERVSFFPPGDALVLAKELRKVAEMYELSAEIQFRQDAVDQLPCRFAEFARRYEYYVLEAKARADSVRILEPDCSLPP